MNQTIQSEMLAQLNASRLNGFPFFAYSGIKPISKMDKGLVLQCPRNPAMVKFIEFTLDEGRDTYNLKFYDNKGNIKTSESDIYADMVAGIIGNTLNIM